MSHKTPWLRLPEALRAQAFTRFGTGRSARPGPGDGYRYHWVRETPPVGYRGPLPMGRLIRRVREG